MICADTRLGLIQKTLYPSKPLTWLKTSEETWWLPLASACAAAAALCRRAATWLGLPAPAGGGREAWLPVHVPAQPLRQAKATYVAGADPRSKIVARSGVEGVATVRGVLALELHLHRCTSGQTVLGHQLTARPPSPTGSAKASSGSAAAACAANRRPGARSLLALSTHWTGPRGQQIRTILENRAIYRRAPLRCSGPV